MRTKTLRMLGFVCLILAAALVWGGCAKPDAAAAEPDAATEPTQSTDMEEPEVNENPVATITMNDGGQIVVELYPDMAPESVKNFISLANDGFYDGLIFHRVIAGFMIQGGDPTGTGMGGPDYSIRGEFKLNGVDNTISHKRGVISMARSQAYDSAGSQFFIVHQDSVFLDGQYAAFGRVTAGMDVVDAIASTKTNASDKPVSDQTIATITVETFGVDYGEPEKIS